MIELGLDPLYADFYRYKLILCFRDRDFERERV